MERSAMARVLGERMNDPPYRPLFPDLVATRSKKEHAAAGERLRGLARTMLAPERAKDEGNKSLDNPRLPAGYTHFGQFVSHDVSFMGQSGRGRLNVHGSAPNHRTPLLDLDCLYGGGPQVSPHLYAIGAPSLLLVGGKRDVVLQGNRRWNDEKEVAEDDLPRNYHGTAIVPDPRNDVSVMVSQIHLSLMRAHNRLASEERTRRSGNGRMSPPEEVVVFERARRTLRHHYQWAVVHDFLPRVLDGPRRDWVRTALEARAAGHRIGTRFYRPWTDPYVPLEFVAGVLRFGHSMLRPVYRLNATMEFPLTPGRWDLRPTSDGHLLGFAPLPDEWTIDWRFFLPVPDGAGLEPLPPELAKNTVQPARRIGPHLTWHLGNLPERLTTGRASLPEMTLLRGLDLGLPSGQAVARAIGEREPLDPLTELDGDETPLWYYVLEEARRNEDGFRLGPVGSTVMAEVVVGLLDLDPESFLSERPDWRPDAIGSGGDCTLADLLLFGRENA